MKTGGQQTQSTEEGIPEGGPIPPHRDMHIRFIFSMFCEYSNLEYIHVHGMYRANQAEYVIRILLAASQEYLIIYSACRVALS